MTLQENIAKYESNVRNWDVKHLKNDPDFMKLCREDGQFRDYVLSVRPDMSNDKGYRMKFLGLDHSKVPVEPETPQIAPEPVEEISKTAKIMQDLKALRKKKGFL